MRKVKWVNTSVMVAVCVLLSVGFVPPDDPVEAVFTLQNGGIIKGEVLSVRDSSIVVSMVLGGSEAELSYAEQAWRVITAHDLRSVVIPGKSHLVKGAGVGGVAGLVLGCATWQQKEAGSFEDFFADVTGASLAGRAATFALVGCVAGGIVGAAISRPDRTVYAAPASSLESIRALARYKTEEPEFLKKVQ
jgi:hypothetical protein